MLHSVQFRSTMYCQLRQCLLSVLRAANSQPSLRRGLQLQGVPNVCSPVSVPYTRLHTTPYRAHGGEFESKDPENEDQVVNVTYLCKDGTKQTIRGKCGDNLMYLAHRYNIEMEGACEASLACSTCHVYVQEEFLDELPEPKEEEEDMLDMAVFLKPNSRLGCQIILNKRLEGLTVTLPSATRNFYVDGHVPEPH